MSVRDGTDQIILCDGRGIMSIWEKLGVQKRMDTFRVDKRKVV